MEKNLKTLLIKHGVMLKKAYGQNFLTDDSLLAEIVEKAGVTKDDTVLEIGCGAGALTRELANKAKRVVGYEIDTRLKPVLEETVGEFDNVNIVFNDVMKEKLSDVESGLDNDYIMVANLPYYITTPIIMRFLEHAKGIRRMVIMVQEEVALRLCATHGTADYGAITVGINLRGKASIIKRVPREMFSPPPNVDSAVVRIDIEEGKFEGVDFNAVRSVVRCGFSSRRKMLVNNLMNGFKLSRAQAEQSLESASIPLTARGETLSAQDYVNLTSVLKQVVKNLGE
ncbi:MAG: ribosomal RNA small subunit methyltransferase A [Clostridia bacterium]|nr:ribosomal RNA small subunit methyltransferase A [Clostridia bacterium]